MTRDNTERLFTYSGFENVEVRRLALNMDQVEQYNPPPNYAKASSSRYAGYTSVFGEHCWELDALEPSVIDNLIDDEIRALIDADAWNECHDEEENRRQYLRALHDSWDDVKDFLQSQI